MANIKKTKGVIGILTGGGDVPGLNPAIRAVTIRALREGYQVIGLRRGWGGLTSLVRDPKADNSDHYLVLTEEIVNKAGRTGGTFLHTARTNPKAVKKDAVPDHLKDTYNADVNDLVPEVLKNLDFLGIDYLIPIGGDDTLSVGVRLYREGFKVVAIPKTMDNDVFGTDYCIGFSTAVTRSVEFITNMRTSVGSHERIGIVELFGRNSGETSLISAYLAYVDRAVITEVPCNLNRLAEYLMEDKRNNPSNYAIMTISEGAILEGGDVVETGEADAYGHRKLGGVGMYVSEEIKRLTGQDIMYQQLAYLMRSGAPDSLDRMVAMSFGHLAIQLIRRNEFGKMVALHGGKYTTVPVSMLLAGKKRVDVPSFYDIETYRPKVRDFMGVPMFLS